MRDKKANGLLPGWPPFTEFKKDMVELLDEAQKPIKSEISMFPIYGQFVKHQAMC